MADIAGLSVSIDVDFGELLSQMDRARKATQELTKELQTTVNQITSISKSLQEAGTQAANSLQQTSRLVARANQENSKSTKELTESIRATGIELRRAATVSSSASQQLTSSIQQAERAIARIGATSQSATGSITNFSRAAASGIQQIGAGATQAAQTTTQSTNKIQQSMQQVGSVSESSARRMEAALNKASQNIMNASNSLQSSLGTLQVVLDKTKNNMMQMTSATDQANRGMIQLKQGQQDVVSGSANLGRFLRVLTTNLFGVNAVSIAVGTALGNLATQLISRVVLGVVSAVTQFGRLRNELAESTFTWQGVRREMEFVTEIAISSGRQVEQLGQRWADLAQRVKIAGGDIEEFRRSFKMFFDIQENVRAATLTENINKLGTAIGNLVSRMGEATGVGPFFSQMVDDLAKKLDKMVDTPEPISDLQRMQERLEFVRKEIDAYISDHIRARHEAKEGLRMETFARMEAAHAEERYLELLEEEQKLAEQIFEIRMRDGIIRTPEQETQRIALHQQILTQLHAENDAAGQHYLTQERIAKVSQLINQFKAAGVELSLQEKIHLTQQLDELVKIGQMRNLAKETRLFEAGKEAQRGIEALRGESGLIQDIILSWNEYEQRRLEIEKNLTASTEVGYEQRALIRDFEIQEQQRVQKAYWDTAKLAGQALTSLFPKSKAAAIANALINTAEGVTMALAKGGPPPLNFIQAGLVAAAGAAQIASIRSANLGGGGSTPRVGGTPSITPVEQRDPGRAIQINMRRGDIWSSDAVAELIERINDEVSNGRTLVSTRTVPI